MINAVSISSRVKKIIEENNGSNIEGFIHSIFDYACNIQIPDRELIGLISKKYGDNPYSITIDLSAGQTMSKLPLHQGMKVDINRQGIGSTDGTFYINLQDAIIWDSTPPDKYKSLVNRSQLKNNIDSIIRILLGKGNFLGIGPLIMDYSIVGDIKFQEFQKTIKTNHYSLFISPRIKDLINGIIKDDKVLIKKILEGIVGFGPGLTPSADDLLVGLIAALYYLGQYQEKEISTIVHLKNSLDEQLTSQTTIVSRQMLKAAIQGEFAKSIKELCITMITTNSKKDLENAVLNAINLGSTSGTDTMVGLLLGVYVIIETI